MNRDYFSNNHNELCKKGGTSETEAAEEALGSWPSEQAWQIRTQAGKL